MPNCNFYAIDNDFVEILDFVFDEMGCRVFESYSAYETELVEFLSTKEVVEYYQLDEFSNCQNRSATLMLWPVKASLNVKVNRIELNPKKCRGATHRYRVDGWGLISLELKGINKAGLQYSHTNHNTEKRATAWEPNYSDVMGSPSEWDWKAVSSASRKLNNFIKKNSNKKVGPMPVMQCAETVTLAGAVAV
ncbi:hypothetical protein SAMN05216262_11565 [Colwellia chukchiensis]|uniref:Uncharacterized protein n=2 Tax=Colwellia chukchiensis TaxID=641665 RepID=A0A1H7RQB5_9GAMM|nr:hypothetical protein [Colwellia chukchiensis]SEL62365.1 hypothetical protein SAMN05216262_11565 [Colwellia chukchiensis]